jgi:signal transduction histidine kinase
MAKSKEAAQALAELAHELRQPLTGIRTSAELLLEARPDDPAVAARLATILQQAQRIQLIADRARREGEPPAAELRAGLNRAAEAALALLEPEAAKAGVAVESGFARAAAGCRRADRGRADPRQPAAQRGRGGGWQGRPGPHPDRRGGGRRRNDRRG